MRDLQELRGDKVHLDPPASPEIRERSESPASLVQLVETVFRVPVDFLVFLVLKVILERMESREKLVHLALRDLKAARGILDPLAVLDLEDSEEKLDQLDPLVTRDPPD